MAARPDWRQVSSALLLSQPQIQYDKNYLVMVLGIIVGTTIAPWMQFYMQSAVIEKGTTMEDYKLALADVIIGCVATVAVAIFIMVACAATLHVNHITINEAKDAALALKPFAGALASSAVFAFGLFCGFHIFRDHSALWPPLLFIFVKLLVLTPVLINELKKLLNFIHFSRPS